jgi:hypothetical protein
MHQAPAYSCGCLAIENQYESMNCQVTRPVSGEHLVNSASQKEMPRFFSRGISLGRKCYESGRILHNLIYVIKLGR